MLFSGELLAQGQEAGCTTQTWLDTQSSGKQSSHFIGVGEAADLDQAYRLADLDLWHGIYRAEGHEPRFAPAEFEKQSGVMPSQDELDNVIGQFYRRALGEAHRERKFVVDMSSCPPFPGLMSVWVIVSEISWAPCCSFCSKVDGLKWRQSWPG